MNDFSSFFKEKFNFEPYKYQRKVADVLLKENKNVILSVPTGAGKTWASVMPFLYAKNSSNIHFPEKMIYSLPLRTLANSIHEDVKKVTEASIQTGEFSEDKYFEKNIIFSTIDQTLSNFLSFPLALSERQSNINAGAIIGSYLVFDEFHLLDEELSMATTIGSLRMLSNLCRCCIMTATLSNKFMKSLQENLDNYEILTLDDFPDDKDKIASLLPKKNKKILKIIDEPLTANDIINNHKGKTIVICNRVEKAQKLYIDIIEQVLKIPKLKKENVICLHSRFFDVDRKEKEKKLKILFGKSANKMEHAILISTQVIEAGMDISCDVMHTEISPVNSFLQRVGRCARFKNEKGEVFVYDILDLKEKEKVILVPESVEDKKELNKINNKYLPYKKELSVLTFIELKKYNTLDDDIPVKLIESVLNQRELDIFKQMAQSNFNSNKIMECWNDCKKNNYRHTIRDIQNVEITIINDSQRYDILKYPYLFQSVGMYKFSLVSWLNKIVKGDGPSNYDVETDWLVLKLQESSDLFLENDEDLKLELNKIPAEDFKNLPNQVFVNAKFFGYHQCFGFNWEYSDTFNHISPLRKYTDHQVEYQPLKKDTFYQHNKALLGAFEKEFIERNNGNFEFAFKELAIYIGIESYDYSDFISAIQLMIILHDYGKLNEKWQRKMQLYQALKEGIDPNKYDSILGHTEFNSNDTNDIELSKKAKLHSRPPHAGIGAFVAQNIYDEFCNNDFIRNGIATAIARHHSPFNYSYSDFEISDKNYAEINRLLEEYKFKVELAQQDYEDRLEGFEYDGEKEWLVYFYFVRILRLCDQKATENFRKYMN